MKKYKKSRLSFDEAVATSKFDFIKNAKWFLIAPAVILLVAIILLCTIGFKSGIDFTGGSVMTVYTNNEGIIEGAEKYDAENQSQYNKIQEKIDAVLKDNGLQAASYQISTMDIEEFSVYGGQAVVVKYQNAQDASSQQISTTNAKIQSQLLQAFGYDELTDAKYAVENSGTVTPTAGNELLFTAVIAVVSSLILVMIYLAFRFDLASSFSSFIAVLHDMFITTAFALIFRITINPAFVIAMIAVMCISLFNNIFLFDAVRTNCKTGAYDNQPNSALTNASIKQVLPRQIYIAAAMFIISALVAIIAVSDVRDFAMPIAIGVVVSLFSSLFVSPVLWSIGHNAGKRKKVKKPSNNDDKVAV